MGSNPYAFAGDYSYQTSQKETIDLDQLEQRTTWMCREWQRTKKTREQGLSSIWKMEVERDAVAYRYDLDLLSILPGRGGGSRWSVNK